MGNYSKIFQIRAFFYNFFIFVFKIFTTKMKNNIRAYYLLAVILLTTLVSCIKEINATQTNSVSNKFFTNITEENPTNGPGPGTVQATGIGKAIGTGQANTTAIIISKRTGSYAT